MASPFTFSVAPKIPERLQPLVELSRNLWWCWNPEAVALFRRLDPELWESSNHNPARMLRRVRQGKLEQAAQNPDFVQHLDDAVGQLRHYLERGDRWFAREHPERKGELIAYFSAEFGFHESLPIYSGGLGILAGDHCKSASDQGLPFVAVGLLYRLGYFKQRINRDGWQESESIQWDFYELPIQQALCRTDGAPVRIRVELPGRTVAVKVWETKIGSSCLFLLDTDLPENSEEDRKITYQLYGGDHEMRIRQEIVLGIGGVQALHALGYSPTVYHLNEGHAAFLGLERIRLRIQEHGLRFDEALQVVAASNVFTTHTPVPAGNDAFDPGLFSNYFRQYAAEMGISLDQLLALGRMPENASDAPFSMTILALRLSRQANGVSAIHGRVARQMWQGLWPGWPQEEVPIGHITNGIHTQTWMAPELQALFEEQDARDWEDRAADPAFWEQGMRWSDAQFWAAHQRLKARLIELVRRKLARQLTRAQFPPEEVRAVGGFLDPEVLTVGFARRFAAYKRAALLLRDPKRLAALVNHPRHPVQFLFAGKAHPADEEGKRLIQQIYQASQTPELRGRLVFIENYDIDVARHLYHGVDVWLNNPTRPLEASGTSGEKVAPNGVLNCSVRDGWWDEACVSGRNGWAIGEGVASPDPAVQDEFDAASLYSLLEQQIAPLFYRRDGENVPAEWLVRVRASMSSIGPVFNTARMVREYSTAYYMRASSHGQRLAADNFARARALAAWKEKVRTVWPKIRARNVQRQLPESGSLIVGQSFPVEAGVFLDGLGAQDVAVEAYVRESAGAGSFQVFRLAPAGAPSDGWQNFRGEIVASDSGAYQVNIRVRPDHADLSHPAEMQLVTWAE